MRYKILVEYDGLAFHGWQRQGHCISVQEVLENALTKIEGKAVTLFAAGRTDAGVHASGQVCHVNLDKFINPRNLPLAINYHLHMADIKDVVAVHAEIVNDDFHCRFDAIRREYAYTIINRPTPTALHKNRAWHVMQPLDLELLHQGAAYLLGTHDFTTFRDTECQAAHAIRTLDRLDFSRQDETITAHVAAKSFLHHQVRNMIGTLSLVGRGVWPPEKIADVLAARDRRAGGQTAPAYGLCLTGVFYN